MGYAGKDGRHRQAHRLLGIADHPQHRQPAFLDRSQEGDQERHARLLKVGGGQHRPALDLSHHPKLLVALFWLQPVQRQHQPTVFLGHQSQPCPDVLAACPQQGEIDLQQMLDMPLRDHHGRLVAEPSPDLLPRAVFRKAQVANPHHHVQAVAMPAHLPRLRLRRAVDAAPEHTGQVAAAEPQIRHMLRPAGKWVGFAQTGWLKRRAAWQCGHATNSGR